MKVAILGKTLHAMVMAGLLAECGHDVFCGQIFDIDHQSQYFQYDASVIQLLDAQHKKGFLHYCGHEDLPLDIDIYVLSFSPDEEQLAIQTLQQLKARPIILPRIMLNASTLGLNGTEKLRRFFPHVNWVYMPDIVQEGNAVQSVTQAKQLVVGCTGAEAQSLIREFLRPLFPRQQHYLFMPVIDAEFTKFSISGMLATRISYMNDLALVAEKLNIDIENVRQGMAADSRIGESYLYPGAGFGGGNFSHDIETLAETVSTTGTKSQLLAQVWEINEQQKELLFRKLWNYFQGNLAGKTIAIWGASFKENTSKIEQSPIHAMLKALWAQGAIVQLHDPQALAEVHQAYGARSDLILMEDQYNAIKNADALCLLTAWKQYASPNFQRMLSDMHHPLILDGRNVYHPDYVKAQGFDYMGVGR